LNSSKELQALEKEADLTCTSSKKNKRKRREYIYLLAKSYLSGDLSFNFKVMR